MLETSLIIIIVLSAIFVALLSIVIYVAVKPGEEIIEPDPFVTETPLEEKEQVVIIIKKEGEEEEELKSFFKFQSVKISEAKWISSLDSLQLTGQEDYYKLSTSNIEMKGKNKCEFLPDKTWLSIQGDHIVHNLNNTRRNKTGVESEHIIVYNDTVVSILENTCTIFRYNKLNFTEINQIEMKKQIKLCSIMDNLMVIIVDNMVHTFVDFKPVKSFEVENVESIFWIDNHYYLVYEKYIEMFLIDMTLLVKRFMFEDKIGLVLPFQKDYLIISFPFKNNENGELQIIHKDTMEWKGTWKGIGFAGAYHLQHYSKQSIHVSIDDNKMIELKINHCNSHNPNQG
jgi:hypothetical protein